MRYNPPMADLGLQIRCQRCGDQMEMRDPAPGQPWMPQQFWVCNRCGRHFWTSYVALPGSKPASPPPVTPGATTLGPTAQKPAEAAASGEAASTAAAKVTHTGPHP
jgi:ribosomal protein L37E